MVRLIIILSLLIFSPIANASDLSESMKDFWNGMGGVSNYNGAGAYEGQSAGYYTLGSLYARNPVKNTQLGAIELPHVKAGCGGINIYNGGFSFLNSEEIVKMSQAIAQNSGAFAFHLAIEEVSSVIAEKIEEFQSWAQRINATMINSCETAASLVGGMWPRHEQASQTICSTLASSSGLVNDYVQAKHKCFEDRAGTKSGIQSHSKAEYEKLMVEDVNLAWKALKESGFLNIGGGNDKVLAELFMTLSGTIIIKGANGASPPKYEYISGRAVHNDIIQTLLEGGEIRYHTCDDTDKCLNIHREGGSHKITEAHAFKAKVEKMINQIIEKIKLDNALSAEEKSFINSKTNIPLYKILNVYAAYSGAGSLFELPVYSEAIALQMLYEYLDDVLRQVDTAADVLIIADDDHLKKFKEGLREARRTLAQREIKTHQSYDTLMRLVDRAITIEGVLAKQIGSPVAESFQWSKGL